MAHFFVKLHIVCNIKQFLSRNHWKILHLTDFFYTTSGCDGCDKYEVCRQEELHYTGGDNFQKIVFIKDLNVFTFQGFVLIAETSGTVSHWRGCTSVAEAFVLPLSGLTIAQGAMMMH